MTNAGENAFLRKSRATALPKPFPVTKWPLSGPLGFFGDQKMLHILLKDRFEHLQLSMGETHNPFGLLFV